MVVAAQILSMRSGFPFPPKHLKQHGKKAWETGRVLWEEGVITQRDLANWTLYCEAIEEKEHCEKIIKRDGDYQKTPTGYFVQHPAVKRRMQVEQVIRRYSQAFGLIPEARKKRPAVSQGVATRKR